MEENRFAKKDFYKVLFVFLYIKCTFYFLINPLT